VGERERERFEALTAESLRISAFVVCTIVWLINLEGDVIATIWNVGNIYEMSQHSVADSS
jgi:hypothetical protein